MPLVFAGVCSHAPGITGRADQADPDVRDAFYAAFDDDARATSKPRGPTRSWSSPPSTSPTSS